MSVAAVSATCLSVRPARLANVCTSDVLRMLAGGPTTMVIHPRAAHLRRRLQRAQLSAKKTQGRIVLDVRGGAAAREHRVSHAKRAVANRHRGGCRRRPAVDRTPPNNSAHSARSAAVRSRRTNSVAKVASTARSAASIASSTSVCVRPFESAESGSSAAAAPPPPRSSRTTAISREG